MVIAILLVIGLAACNTEPAQNTSSSVAGDTEPSDTGSEPTRGTGDTDPTDETVQTDSTESTDATDPSESAGTTDPTQETDATQSTDTGNGGGSTNTTQPTDPPDGSTGTKSNPAALTIGKNTAKPTASSGYYYTYTATKDETLKLEFSDSWAYEINNLTAGTAMTQKSSAWDGEVNPVQIGLLKGDKLEIIVKQANGKAGTVNFKASISADQLGSKNNQILVQVGHTIGIRVAAGATAYFHGHVSGTWMSIGNAADAKLKFNNKTYSPSSGKIELSIPSAQAGNAGDREFAITNNSGSVQIYTVNCYVPTGTWDNPESLTMGTHTVNGSTNGYVYQWKATKAGTFTIQITSGNWLYSIDQIDKNYVPKQYMQDSNGNGDANCTNPLVITVAAGDTIKILINTSDGSSEKVTFNVSFE